MRYDLAAIDVVAMLGLEIGPLANPRVGKDDGPVRYLDHASADELKQKYATNAEMQDRLDRIVEVDYVIGEGKKISEAVAQDAPFDYVIASHLIEHIPDPVGWMADVASILRPGGILSLVIPDKRYCFDINRAPSDISDVVDAYLRQLVRPSYKQVYDFTSRAINGAVDTHAVWAEQADYTGVVRTDCDDPDVAALEACRRLDTSDEFVDVHCHAFTPDSFLELFEKLARLGLVDFELARFFPTQFDTLEFHASLRLLERPVDRSTLLRRQLASVARARGGEVAGDRARAAPAPPAAVTMDLSERERRWLLLKRRAMEGIREALNLRRRG
ncbi:MAG TPA: methyltransferase domain-containing protein [Acidimicrobiales bacterium]|jgi:SAM-dependent methyltransferase|nr:methyltransferase domain-containing protein [Acidimicrobiales bacterium]